MKITIASGPLRPVATAGRRTSEVAKRFSYNAVAEQYLSDFAALLETDCGRTLC